MPDKNRGLVTYCTADRGEWREWLRSNYRSADEVWFVFPSPDSGEKCLPYNDAVEEALCFGWIDGRADKLDPMHGVRRFTPRNSASFSRINIERLL